VPSSREITVSINDGVPVTLSGSNSEAAKALDSLADLFAAPAMDVEASEAPSRFKDRLWRRKRTVGAPAKLARGL
jgi:MinD-like ATPase involved in chromosome partitioning or flagellar assembly